MHPQLTAAGRIEFHIENVRRDILLASNFSVAYNPWHRIAANWELSAVELDVDGRQAARAMMELGLLDETEQPILTRKGELRKVSLASVLKAHTSVDNEWTSLRLTMGHNRSVSRLIQQGNDNPETERLCSEVPRTLPYED